ncbi:MAG: substrate-binding domain-containing protein, partial [Pirellulaceae bacterium]|nr:substrate-binding domain-containing protein [Pirellulaceae bacterium]
IPFVGLDNGPIARLAYEHLRDLELRHFAFCGTPRGENPNQDFRCDSFRRLVERDGRSCEVWLGEHLEKHAVTWEDQQRDLANWLRKLPKPVGIMTCHDDRGQQVLDACHRVDLAVPDHAAVISVDNDPCLCNLCTPTLTSIDVNPSHVGYAAAELLDRLMRGEKPQSMTTYLGPPRGIASRRSTDMLAIDDQDVAEAVRHIRRHATRGIRVSDVIARADKSPSTLERRFRKVVGRTIKAEITRVKLNRAKLLLAETDYAVGEIAERSGFGELKYFCEVFRKHVGVTALEYRRTFRDE